MKPATKKVTPTDAEYLHERVTGETPAAAMAPEFDMRITPIGYSVHLAGHNPVFGESATHVTIDDEAGGPFLVLQQFRDDQELKPGRVKLCLDELERVLETARILMAAWPEEADTDVSNA